MIDVDGGGQLTVVDQNANTSETARHEMWTHAMWCVVTLFVLAAGDIVAADARLDSAESMQVDESMLTGESMPAAERVGEHPFAGTIVNRGRGDAVVEATAHDTAIGGIATSLRDAERVLTPLQRQLATLGRRLAIAVAVAAAVVATISLLSGRSVEISLVLAISLAVAALRT